MQAASFREKVRVALALAYVNTVDDTRHDFSLSSTADFLTSFSDTVHLYVDIVHITRYSHVANGDDPVCVLQLLLRPNAFKLMWVFLYLRVLLR